LTRCLPSGEQLIGYTLAFLAQPAHAANDRPGRRSIGAWLQDTLDKAISPIGTVILCWPGGWWRWSCRSR
jgi:hypothetical protein